MRGLTEGGYGHGVGGRSHGALERQGGYSHPIPRPIAKFLAFFFDLSRLLTTSLTSGPVGTGGGAIRVVVELDCFVEVCDLVVLPDLVQVVSDLVVVDPDLVVVDPDLVVVLADLVVVLPLSPVVESPGVLVLVVPLDVVLSVFVTDEETDESV